MKNRFLVHLLLAIAFGITLVLAFCIQQCTWIPRFWPDFVNYPRPVLGEFSPEKLHHLNSKTSVLVVAYNPFFNGIENFILDDKEIKRYCALGKLVVLREVYEHEHEHDYHDYFSERFGYHKEPIFVLYCDGKAKRLFEVDPNYWTTGGQNLDREL